MSLKTVGAKLKKAFLGCYKTMEDSGVNDRLIDQALKGIDDLLDKLIQSSGNHLDGLSKTLIHDVVAAAASGGISAARTAIDKDLADFGLAGTGGTISDYHGE